MFAEPVAAHMTNVRTLGSMTSLQWSRRFPLRDAFTRNEHGGGLYLWGFDGYDGEVVWYVGKATTGKGVPKRLRKHYLDVMSGQY